jgi:two-component system, NtrC family, sensor kinase
MVKIITINVKHGKFYRWIILASLILSISPVQAQNKQRDSLFKSLSMKINEVQRINALNAIGKSYWNFNNDSAVYFSDSARRHAKSLGDIEGEAEGNRIIGVTKWYQEKGLEDIKPYLEQALSLYKVTGNRKGIADTYNNLGSMWRYVGNYSESLVCYDSSLSIYQKLGDKKGEAAVFNYIGIAYQYMGELSKAIDYTLKGLVIRKSTNDHLGIVFSYLNVGNIFLAGGQPERATKYYQEGLDYAIKQGVVPPPMTFNVLGNSYLQLGDLKKAEEYLLPGKNERFNKYPDNIFVARLFLAKGQLDSAEKYFQKVFSETGLNAKKDREAQSMAGLSRILIMKGNIPLAIDMANKSYILAGPVNKLTVAESAGILAELYEKNGQQGKALSFLKIQHGILDSVTNRNYQNKLAYFESSTELEKVQNRIQAISVQKELQEKLYKQEKLLKNFLIVISILILLAAFFVFRNMSARRKRIIAQNELLDEQNKKVNRALEDLQAAQAQLIQSEKMASLGELTAGIAHEIQNPLNFVNNFSEVNKELLYEMKSEIEKGNISGIMNLADDLGQNLDKIEHHGKRADAIVKSMLQHSHASAGQMVPTDINVLTDEYFRLAFHGLRAKDKSFNATLETIFDSSIGLIKIIPQDIGRVLLNLFNNAFYAVTERKKLETTGYEPTISVSTKKIGEKIMISVKDNGMGIPGKVKDKIFQPFYTTKPTGLGTGLGLSLSYDIVKAHGGELKVESEEGEWAEFIIQLPLNKEQSP